MVERRDQVRTTFLSLARFIVSILVIRWVSMNGPFFVLRAMCPLESLLSSSQRSASITRLRNFPISQFLLASAIDDELVSALVVACLVAACRLSPWGHRMASTGRLTFAAAMWVIDGIHRHTAIHWTPAQPALAASFAD